MIKFTEYKEYGKAILAFMSLTLFFFGDTFLFALTYSLITIFLIIKTFFISTKKRVKLSLIIIYLMILIFQLSYSIIRISDMSLVSVHLSKFIGVILLYIPFLIEKMYIINDYTNIYFPKKNNIATISFSILKDNKDNIISRIENIKQVSKGLTTQNIIDILVDLPRHGYVTYVNDGHLTNEYFKMAYDSLSDPYVYIVLSNTGSAASEIISSFTKKNYSHCSISFDSDLQSIISYNGGNNINPPGLNHELIEFFNKKDDASIIVYKLYAGTEKKKLMIDKAYQINEQGSAYNMMGIFTKRSLKPNMMLCSQFVYIMLKEVGLNYFDKRAPEVRPCDFVELDYYRKLKFEYEIFLNNSKTN